MGEMVTSTVARLFTTLAATVPAAVADLGALFCPPHLMGRLSSHLPAPLGPALSKSALTADESGCPSGALMRCVALHGRRCFELLAALPDAAMAGMPGMGGNLGTRRHGKNWAAANDGLVGDNPVFMQ